MTELKTKPNDASVEAFIMQVEDPKKREDSFAVIKLMQKITGAEAKMWGGSIVGFGTYHYVYATGNSGDWPVVGFSPRKQNLTLYIMAGFSKYEALMETLGKYKTGKPCLYVKRLSDIDLEVLETLIRESVEYMKGKYETSFE
jgi:hypothetical protein